MASGSATFGCFERRSGVPPVGGGTRRLPCIVGPGRAPELILTGRKLDAETAAEWGPVNRLAPAGAALETAVELAEVIAGFPQETVGTDRAAVHDGLGETLEHGLAIEGWHGSRAMETAREGADRFAGGEGRGGEEVPGGE